MYAPTCIANKNWTCREIYRTCLTVDVIYVAILATTHVRMMVMIVVNDGDDDCDGGEGNGSVIMILLMTMMTPVSQMANSY